MDRVSHDEMLELASLGAGVMHSRSIEFGKKFDVPIHVRNSASFSDEPGTIIGSRPESSDRAVSGCALTKNEARISLTGVPDKPGTMHRIFSRLATVNIAVDMIVQNIGADGSADIAFTVLENDLPGALKPSKKAAHELGGEGCRTTPTCRRSRSSASAWPRKPASPTGCSAPWPTQVNIQAITTSQIKISVPRRARARRWKRLRAVHDEFELEKPPQIAGQFGEKRRRSSEPSPVDVVSRLQRMEDLTIDDIRSTRRRAASRSRTFPTRPASPPRFSKRSPPRACWST